MRASLKTKKEHAHEDGVWACTWTPDGKLVTGSVDETVRVWELADGSLDEPQHTFSGQYLGVVGVSVDASGQFVATTALDSFIRVWSIVTHQERALIETPPTETWGLAFNPASPNLQLATAGGSSSLLRIYDLGPVHDDPEQPLSMSPSAVLNLPKIIMDQSQEPDAQPSRSERCQDIEARGQNGDSSRDWIVREPEDRNTEKGSKERSNFLLSVAFSPDGTRLACGAFDGSATVFDVASQKVAMVMKGHHKPIRDLSFSPDGSLLMTACDDMHVNVYEMGSSEPVKVFSGHESWVLSLSPHPGGNFIATGSSDGKAKLWDIRTGICMHTKSDHSDQIWGVGFDPTGELLATAGDDGAVALYSVVQ